MHGTIFPFASHVNILAGIFLKGGCYYLGLIVTHMPNKAYASIFDNLDMSK